MFNIQLAGVSQQSDFINGLLTIMPQTTITAIRKTDLIIIPAIKGDFTKPNGENLILVNWIREQYENGAEIASMCTGAYLLASTGLPDNRTCSIHWNSEKSREYHHWNIEINIIRRCNTASLL